MSPALSSWSASDVSNFISSLQNCNGVDGFACTFTELNICGMDICNMTVTQLAAILMDEEAAKIIMSTFIERGLLTMPPTDYDSTVKSNVDLREKLANWINEGSSSLPAVPTPPPIRESFSMISFPINGGKTNDSAQRSATKSVPSINTSSQADDAKNRGNSLLKEGNVKEAIEAYSEGLRQCPDHPVLLTNRAQAHIKLNQWQAAKNDCDRALHCFPSSTHATPVLLSKTYYRRGLCLQAMDQLELSLVSYERALTTSPSNDEALTKKKEVMALIDSEQSRRAKSKTNGQQSVKLPDVNHSVTTPDIHSSPSQSSPMITSPVPSIIPSVTTPSSPDIVATLDAVVHVESSASSVTGSITASTTTPIHSSSTDPITVPPAAQTCSNFERDLISLNRKASQHGCHDASRWLPMGQYISQFSELAITDIITTCLDSDSVTLICRGFSALCEDVKHHSNHSPLIHHCLSLLQGISKNTRFDMAISFVSSSERQVIEHMFVLLLSLVQVSDDESLCKSLRLRYGIDTNL